MTTEALDKFRERAAELERTQGKLPNTRQIEAETARRAEIADRQREEQRGKPRSRTPAQMENMVEVIDRWGTRSTFKEKDCPIK